MLVLQGEIICRFSLKIEANEPNGQGRENKRLFFLINLIRKPATRNSNFWQAIPHEN